jgi:hypothetical protein
MLFAAVVTVRADVMLTPVVSKPTMPITIDDLWPEEGEQLEEGDSEEADWDWVLDPNEEEPLTDPEESEEGNEDDFVIVLPGDWDYRFPTEGEELYMLQTTATGSAGATAVSEPATIVVLAMGLVGLISCRWWRRIV